MRPETVLFLAAFAGAGLVIAGFVDEARRGADSEVRGRWMDVVPQLCAAVAVFGVALARRRPQRATAGYALTNAAFTAMLTHATLVLTTFSRPDEPAFAKAKSALVIAGFLALSFALLAATQRPMLRPSLVWLVRGIAALAAVLSVWCVFHVIGALSALALVGALMGVATLVAAVRSAQALVPRAARA